MKIIDNVFLIKTAIANFYLILEESHVLLIDAGLPGNIKRIDKQLKNLGKSLADITKIVITHADADHYGSALALLNTSSASILANPVEATAIRAGGNSRELHPRGLEKYIYKLSALIIKASPTPVHADILGGEILPYQSGLQVISTPGHTPGHISLFSQSQGVLFAGDSIWMKGGKLVPSCGANCWDEKQAITSFNNQMAFHPRIICMGHGIYRDNP
jgi:glyoxylase-like metal-dependent hydrolase (beta-lactamase superfamily II)